MELRHLRYFVMVAEQLNFVRAAGRLRVAQSSLSKQIHNLEAELGVRLFHRLPRGVRLTAAGEAFLTEARATLEKAAHAVASARRAEGQQASRLHFVLRELVVYASIAADLLAAFRTAYPALEVEVLSLDEEGQRQALRARSAEVALTVVTGPVDEFRVHRLANFSLTGVLLPGNHPLASKPVVQLRELEQLPFLTFKRGQWPEVLATIDKALAERGLVPRPQRGYSTSAPSTNLQIAAGGAWALANEAMAATYCATSKGIVYRKFAEPPIPAWLALLYLRDAPPQVERLIEVARSIGLSVDESDSSGAAPGAMVLTG